MTTIRTTILLAFALVATALPMLPSAAADDPAPTLPPACEAALTRAREVLRIQQATISVADAVALLQAEAGEPCGFDIYRGEFVGDGKAVATFAAQGTPSGIKFVPPDIGVPQGVVEDLPAIGAVSAQECFLPGAGDGSIQATVLGVELDAEVARGQWQPVAEGFEVDGEGGVFGGTQVDSAGVIRVLSVAPILALEGDTGAVCVETETTSTVRESCFLTFWPIGYACETTTKTTSQLALCTAWAEQKSILNLVRLDHDYEFDAAPAECAEL